MPRKSPNSRGPLGMAAVFAAVLVLISSLMELSVGWNESLLISMKSEWLFWMPVASVLGMLVILYRRGLPKSIWQAALFVLINLGLIAVARLVWQGELANAVWLTIDASTRLVLAACWVVVGCGAVAIPVWLKNRVPSAPAPVWVKMWFATALFIGMAELGTRVLQRQPQQSLELPANWLPRDPSNTEFRIAAIGGSTMRGFPYEPKIDIVTVCQAHLEVRSPDRSFLVDNMARTGINLRGAIERLALLEDRPDMIVMYAGHNEAFFDVESDAMRPESSVPHLDACFQWSSAYRVFSTAMRNGYIADHDLEDFGRKLFEAPLYTDDVSHERLGRFRRTLVEFARLCRQENISLVWFVPAAGEGTFEPNRSWVGSEVPMERQDSVQQLLDETRRVEQVGRWSEAEDIYRDLLKEYAGFAELHYRLAECLVAQDRIAEAKLSFREAIDCDGFSCRATSSYRQCIVDVAREEQIPLVDAEEVLSAVSESGLLDRTVMHDHVHPTLAGYSALGRALADLSVMQSLAVDGHDVAPVKTAAIDFPTLLNRAEFDAEDLAVAYDRIAFALDHLAVKRYDPNLRHAEATQYRQWATRLRSGEIQPGEEGTESLSHFQPGGVRFPTSD